MVKTEHSNLSLWSHQSNHIHLELRVILNNAHSMHILSMNLVTTVVTTHLDEYSDGSPLVQSLAVGQDQPVIAW